MFLSSTFYHLLPQRYDNILKQARKSGESFEKNIVGASRHQKFYQGNEQNKVLYKAFAPSGRRAKCDDTQGDALGYELLPLQGVWGYPYFFCPFWAWGAILTSSALSGRGGNRNYINCCIWLSVNPVISITVAASMPFASIFLAISILLWLLPTSSPFAMPC